MIGKIIEAIRLKSKNKSFYIEFNFYNIKFDAKNF